MKQTLETISEDAFSRLDAEAARQVMGAATAREGTVKFTQVGVEIGPNGEIFPSYIEDPD